MNENEISEMIELAMQARTKAYEPYSNFQVGACVKMENGSYYTGCNIENASYGATNCAERTAVFKAVSEGVLEFDAICVVGGMNKVLKEYAAPCGVCRQVMMEFCDPDTLQTGHCRICRTRLRDRCSKEQTGISDVFGRRAASGDISFE